MSLALVHASAQVRELLRLPSFSVPTFGFPIALFLFFGSSSSGRNAAFVLASFAAFAVLSVAFFQFGVGIAHERTSPWELFVRTLPITERARFAARLLAALPFAGASAAGVAIVALLTTPAELSATAWVRLGIALFVGSVPLALLGIAIGYWTTPRGALPLANALFLGLSFAGGLWTAPSALPPVVADVSPFLPTRQWGELLWESVAGRPWSGASWLALAAYGIAFGSLAAWGYRRDEGQRYR